MAKLKMPDIKTPLGSLIDKELEVLTEQQKSEVLDCLTEINEVFVRYGVPGLFAQKVLQKSLKETNTWL